MEFVCWFRDVTQKSLFKLCIVPSSIHYPPGSNDPYTGVRASPCHSLLFQNCPIEPAVDHESVSHSKSISNLNSGSVESLFLLTTQLSLHEWLFVSLIRPIKKFCGTSPAFPGAACRRYRSETYFTVKRGSFHIYLIYAQHIASLHLWLFYDKHLSNYIK